MKVREGVFVVFALFVAISSSYIAFELANSALGVTAAMAVAGIVFTAVVLWFNRIPLR
jgi:hypothetical protein